MICPHCKNGHHPSVIAEMKFIGVDKGGPRPVNLIVVVDAPRSIYWCPTCGTVGDGSGEYQVPEDAAVRQTLDSLGGKKEITYAEFARTERHY